MDKFYVEVGYIDYTTTPASTKYLSLYKRSSSAALVISTVSALFSSLFNCKNADGSICYKVLQVSANLISSDSAPESDSVEEPNSEDPNNSEEPNNSEQTEVT